MTCPGWRSLEAAIGAELALELWPDGGVLLVEQAPGCWSVELQGLIADADVSALSLGARVLARLARDASRDGTDPRGSAGRHAPPAGTAVWTA
jgi:hypothetical protein